MLLFIIIRFTWIARVEWLDRVNEMPQMELQELHEVAVDGSEWRKRGNNNKKTRRRRRKIIKRKNKRKSKTNTKEEILFNASNFEFFKYKMKYYKQCNS